MYEDLVLNFYGDEVIAVDFKDVMNYENAARSLQFESVMNKIDQALKDHFVRSGLGLASTWAHILPEGTSKEDAHASF